MISNDTDTGYWIHCHDTVLHMFDMISIIFTRECT